MNVVDLESALRGQGSGPCRLSATRCLEANKGTPRGKGDARRVGMKIPDIEAYSHGGVRFQKDKSSLIYPDPRTLNHFC